MINHPLPYDAIFFDADGTLRRCTVPGQPCPNREDEWELMPNVVDVLALYDWYRVGMSIISNQGGISLGYLTKDKAYQLLGDMVHAAFNRFWSPDWVVFLCPHVASDGCDCRKPKPKMLLDAEMYCHRMGILHAPRTALYVGDMETDAQAAQAANLPFMWASEFFGWS